MTTLVAVGKVRISTAAPPFATLASPSFLSQFIWYLPTSTAHEFDGKAKPLAELLGEFHVEALQLPVLVDELLGRVGRVDRELQPTWCDQVVVANGRGACGMRRNRRENERSNSACTRKCRDHV